MTKTYQNVSERANVNDSELSKKILNAIRKIYTENKVKSPEFISIKDLTARVLDIDENSKDLTWELWDSKYPILNILHSLHKHSKIILKTKVRGFNCSVLKLADIEFKRFQKSLKPTA